MNTKEKVLIHKGMDRVRRMQYQEALEIFDKVLSMNATIPEAWNNKGVALFHLGRESEALGAYDKALELDPQYLEALRNKGFVLKRVGRLEDALTCYDAVLRAGGDVLDLESRAEVLARMGRLEEALDCLQQAAEIKPSERFEEGIKVLKDLIQKEAASPSQGKE
jgi:tetratricopeptide (TPR) repeat protein